MRPAHSKTHTDTTISLHWLLGYLYLGLDCDVPILEAIHHTGILETIHRASIVDTRFVGSLHELSFHT